VRDRVCVILSILEGRQHHRDVGVHRAEREHHELLVRTRREGDATRRGRGAGVTAARGDRCAVAVGGEIGSIGAGASAPVGASDHHVST
jgi:hypothetical protein